MVGDEDEGETRVSTAGDSAGWSSIPNLALRCVASQGASRVELRYKRYGFKSQRRGKINKQAPSRQSIYIGPYIFNNNKGRKIR